MSIQDLLSDVRNEKPKTKLEEFKKNLDPNGFRNNLFEVKFTELPGASENLIMKAKFMINSTKIPAVGDGWSKDWYIRVLMDIELYDLFRTWAESNFEARGAAIIVLYKQDGSVLREYPVKNLQITEVSSIDLAWDETQDEFPTFEVCFKIEPPEDEPLSVLIDKLKEE